MTNDPRVKAACAAFYEGWYGENPTSVQACVEKALESADAADDHVRVPREVLQIMRERAETGDLGTLRWRLSELLGGIPE